MLLLRNKSRLRIHKSGCCASVRKHSYSDEESERKTHTATLVIRNAEPQGEGGPGTSKEGGRRAPWTNAGDPRASDVSAAVGQDGMPHTSRGWLSPCKAVPSRMTSRYEARTNISSGAPSHGPFLRRRLRQGS